MKKYIVRFITTSDDYDKEWTYADSAEEAASIIKHDHWNIREVTSVTEIKN